MFLKIVCNMNYVHSKYCHESSVHNVMLMCYKKMATKCVDANSRERLIKNLLKVLCSDIWGIWWNCYLSSGNQTISQLNNMWKNAAVCQSKIDGYIRSSYYRHTFLTRDTDKHNPYKYCNFVSFCGQVFQWKQLLY